jgi:hypothetical protein
MTPAFASHTRWEWTGFDDTAAKSTKAACVERGSNIWTRGALDRKKYLFLS